VKPDINHVEVHPHLSHKWHPVDGVLVGAGSLWWSENTFLLGSSSLANHGG